MNTRYQVLFSALAVAASLCWQAPAVADSWAHPGAAQQHGQDRPDNSGGRNGYNRNAQDPRSYGQNQRSYGQNPGYDRPHGGPAPYNANNGSRGESRYSRYPGNPGYPARAAYSGGNNWRGDNDGRGDRDGRGESRYPRYPGYSYPVYPRYQAYYPYGGYPGYYGYYGPTVYSNYYGGPAPYGYGYGVVNTGGCNADGALGVVGAVTGALVGNNNSAPRNRGVGTVIGAIAGGIIGTAVGGAIDNGCYGH
jgi:Glycine zipper